MAQDSVGIETQALSLVEVEVLTKTDTDLIDEIRDVTFWLTINQKDITPPTDMFLKVHNAKTEFLRLLLLEKAARGIA